MKLILAIIQPTKLAAVREALQRIGVERMTVCDSQGFGRQRGQTATYRGIEYKTHLLAKFRWRSSSMTTSWKRRSKLSSRIARTGSEGNIGDGKIFVLPAERSHHHQRRRPRAQLGVKFLYLSLHFLSEIGSD